MEDIQEERTRLSRAQATLRSAHDGIDAAPRPHARASTQACKFRGCLQVAWMALAACPPQMRGTAGR
ncbi:hypothetical protein AN652_19525 [Xanthomonas arboricola pv. pruni]|nr:hypothetical protein AKJ12_19325 [Xanthomonas arboricola pv. juglandis]KCW99668.1 hypothetical protein DK27_00265 [Xanthomonas arboricola pv. pruni]KOA98013.1 hypothetical protein AE920_16065 [Xanthomonas arboricola]PPU10879.1 hypothetical protein XacyCFBP2565_18740 [Xanthomonas arboricola pv. corylina]KOA99572.1 hypothetical protein AE921_11825 [Xanthomonas arboricola]